jgi:hypothetical protein
MAGHVEGVGEEECIESFGGRIMLKWILEK